MLPENQLSARLANPYLLTLLLTVLVVAGNFFSISLFFGVDLIFGSIFVLTAVSLLGRFPVFIVALAGGLYTWMLWGHPYALIVFLMEAAAVYWLHRYRNHSLCAADAIFWLCTGIPLIIFFYAFSLDLPVAEAVFIAFKQAINGVFNAVMAGFLILLTNMVAQRVSLAYLQVDQVRAILFNSIFAIAFTAGTLPIVQYGQFEELSHKNLLESELSAEVEQMAFFLGTQGGFDREAWRGFIERWNPRADLSFAVLDSEGSALTRVGDPWIRPDDDRISPTDVEGLALLGPEQDLPRLKRWQQSRYQIVRSVDVSPVVSVIGQLPAAALMARMRSDSVRFLGLLGGLLVLGMLVSRFLSTILTMPIRRLSTALNISTNGILITDVDGRVKWLNAGFTRVTGFSLVEMDGVKPGDILQGADTDPETVDRIRHALGQRVPFEEEILNYHKSGRAYWVRINCEPLYREDGVFNGFLAVESDVTEHRKTAALERFGSEALEQIVENAPLEDIYLTVIRNVEFLIPDLRCVVELVSTLPDQTTALPFVDFLDVDAGGIKERDFCRYNSIPIIDSNKVQLGMLKVFYAHQNRRPPTDLYVIEKATQIIAVALERSLNERKLKESASVFRWAREGIFTTDADFMILNVNNAFTFMTGYEREEVAGSRPDLLYVDGSDRNLFSAIEAVLRDSGQWQGEIWINSKVGAGVPVLQSVSVIRGKHGEIQRYSFVLSDITELKSTRISWRKWRNTIRSQACRIVYCWAIGSSRQ
ncbi:MAG: PAS domain-containing protein [Marinobacter sp.]